jgi:hypothetical protein
MGLSPDAWASIGTTLFNTGSQLYTNSLNRKNALADWNRQNAYNNPKQQMQRYKEAGLNPNLIYNQQNTAQPVRSTDYVAPQAPDFQGVLAKSAQIKLQDQQLKNMSLQNDAIAAQILKTKADALSIEELKQIQIKDNITLGEIATVSDSLSDASSYASLDGVEGVMLEVQKISGENTIDIVDKVKNSLPELEKLAGEKYDVKLLNDTSPFILESLKGVEFDLIYGAFLATLIALLFFFFSKT